MQFNIILFIAIKITSILVPEGNVFVILYSKLPEYKV